MDVCRVISRRYVLVCDVAPAVGRSPLQCTQNEILSVADAIVDQGLDKLGYEYLVMDDCWSATTRNATGHLQPEPSQFPLGFEYLTCTCSPQAG